MSLLRQLRGITEDMQPTAHGDDRRVEMRVWSIRINGRLTVNGDARSCLISDVSAAGLRIETRDLPPPGQRVWIEARGFASASAVVVWSDGTQAGLVFDTIQDLSEVFAIRRNEPTNRPRSPRFKLLHPPFRAPIHALLEGPHGISRLEVADISLGGVKLRGKTVAAVGHRGAVQLSDEHCVAGEIRWRRANFLGFHFAQPMSSDELFCVLAGKDYALSL